MSRISKTHLRDEMVGGEYLVRIWGDSSNVADGIYWVDFEVLAVAGADDQDNILYQRAGAISGMDTVTSPDEAEATARGFVKWDGCTQFTMDAHVDDKEGMDQLMASVCLARQLAAHAMAGTYDCTGEYP